MNALLIGLWFRVQNKQFFQTAKFLHRVIIINMNYYFVTIYKIIYICLLKMRIITNNMQIYKYKLYLQ